MSDNRLSPTAPLMEAVRSIETSRRRMAVVVGEDGKLLGTLTDGDVRRALLAGGTLEMPVAQAMNAKPITADVDSAPDYLIDLMRKGNILAVPLVDSQGHFQRLIHLTDIDQRKSARGTTAEFEFAVIMAGGEGMRLRPLTEDIPKPMLKVGGTPLLERQVQQLAAAGIKRVYIALNYLGHVIENHFGDGSRFDIEIRYLREQEKRGTAGGLFLLPETPAKPILVMNGDILTTSDFGSLSAFHQSHAASVTVAAIDYHVNIPYGVLRAEGAYVSALVEKPSERFLCNAGMYAVSPESLSLLQHMTYCNMTDIIEECLTKKLPVAVFPIHEYWSDVGTPDDLKKAQEFFNMVSEDA